MEGKCAASKSVGSVLMRWGSDNEDSFGFKNNVVDVHALLT